MNAVLYFAALAALAALIVLYIVRHLRKGGGCCGEHDASPAKVRPADRDASRYPHRYSAKIDGMVCGSCARRVENLFHETGEFLASVRLSDKSAEIRAKRETPRAEAAKMLEQAGFTLIEWEEHHDTE